MTIVTINQVNEDHMVKVMEYAKTVGSVTVNVYDNGEMIYALEGSHRIEAANRLGLPLVLIPKEWDDEIATDCEDVGRDDNGYATVAAIYEYAYDNMACHDGGVYSEDDFVSVEVA